MTTEWPSDKGHVGHCCFPSNASFEAFHVVSLIALIGALLSSFRAVALTVSIKGRSAWHLSHISKATKRTANYRRQQIGDGFRQRVPPLRACTQSFLCYY